MLPSFNSTIPNWLAWIHFISPYYFGNEGFYGVQWRDQGPIPGCETTLLGEDVEASQCLYEDGDAVLEFYEYTVISVY